jgi:hypothetical protein
MHDAPPPQRPSDKASYRLEPITSRHVEQSRRMILQAAARAGQGRAVILGAGACEEIPLLELTGQFAEVTLNDIEAAPLHQAIAALPADVALRTKLRVHAADLTSATEKSLAGIDTVLADATDSAQAIAAMGRALDDTQPDEFPIDGQFELVVASCLLSQLHFALTHAAAARFAARFPEQAESLARSDAWKKSLYAAARRMEDRFIADLAALAMPRGAIYLSESAQMCYVRLAPDGAWQTDGTYRMLRSTNLEDYIRGRFAVIERGRWEWVVSPPKKQGDTGRLYDVQALVLQAPG